MTAINEMLQQPLAQAIGWALLQFVWQGTLIAVLTALLLAALRRSGPDVRYVVSAIALALMLTVPVVTVMQTLGAAGPASEESQPAPAIARATVTAGSAATSADSLPARAAAGAAAASWTVDEWLPSLVSIWLIGVVVLTLRLFSGWMWVQSMKTHGARPAPDVLQTAARRLMRRLHIGRPVRFLESSRVAVPTVIGWLTPAVLLPASALAGLSPDQIEAILAHELAHIRRHDYAVNLLQAVVETLLFYHPAVWWLSRRIRIEREHCCDDLAVSLCGDPVAYAAALAELEGLRSESGAVALAATGGSLLQRVRRVLGAPTHAGRAPAWLAAGVALLVVVSMSAGTIARDALTGEPQGSVAAVPAAATQRPARAVAAEDAREAIPAVTAATTVGARSARPAAASEQAVAATTRVEGVAADTAAPARSSEAAVAAVAATIGSLARQPVEAGAAAAAAIATTATTVVQAVAAAASTVAQSSGGKEKSGNFVWSDDGQKLEVSYRGDIEFTADDTDVSRISPGGFLRIRDSRRGGTDNSVEFRADSSGTIERRFWVASRERPFDPEGRKWLAERLPKFIRQSGIGAPARVARFMKSGGASAVLAEITRIEGSWGKRLYFTELFKQQGLSAGTVQQALAQAGREIDSDYELASLLISSNTLVTDDGARRAYLDAARTIESDYEMRRVLSSIVKTGTLSSTLAGSVLDASTSIDSDYEEATLLIEFAGRQSLDGAARASFFKALATVASAYERRRVLTAIVQRPDLSADARVAALESASGVDSDYEAATFLVQFLKEGGAEGAARAPFFHAVASIDSAFERGRVLQALARRSDVSDATVLEILRSARTMNSGHERSQVLLAIAAGQQLTREGRDAYIDAAENLGDYEQGRVLSALVRNERRK
jgi:beta-lactamase regulating signal transducer with metallopeptidase domain